MTPTDEQIATMAANGDPAMKARILSRIRAERHEREARELAAFIADGDPESEAKLTARFLAEKSVEANARRVELYRGSDDVHHGVHLLSMAGAPPKEFRLFGLGVTDTKKGKFKLTSEGMKKCLDAALDWGVRMVIDFEHQSFMGSIVGAVSAAGWFTLAGRADGLYAVDIDWTEKAATMITKREVKYVSPAFHTTKDGEIVEIVNCAVTVMPATKNAQPLQASR